MPLGEVLQNEAVSMTFSVNSQDYFWFPRQSECNLQIGPPLATMIWLFLNDSCSKNCNYWKKINVLINQQHVRLTLPTHMHLMTCTSSSHLALCLWTIRFKTINKINNICSFKYAFIKLYPWNWPWAILLAKCITHRVKKKEKKKNEQEQNTTK